MKKVYGCENSLMATRIQSLLEPEGIRSLIKNQNLSGALGELPINECWPEIWIMDDADYDRAMEIVSTVLSDADIATSPWNCSCGEKIEGQFTECWNCGKEKPQ